MKTLITTLILSTLIATAPAMAGSNHEHGHGHSHGSVSKEKVVYKAEKRLKRLALQGKIDKVWVGKKATAIDKKTYSGQEEWVVTFNNPKIADKSKQTLYMFFKLDGHYLATNYTGK